MHQTPNSEAHTTEALIIGGGPAGLAASIALRQRGIDCTVLEARPPAIDKACGEGLMPDSRDILAQLGVTLSDSDGYLFHGIRFANGSHSVDANFPDGAGIGVRRPRLHTLLTERAEQAGARLLFNTRVQLPADEFSTRDAEGYQTAIANGEPIRFRYLVGADGQASSVRKWAGLDDTRKSSVRYGFRTHYRVAPWSEYVEIHWGTNGQLYITPVATDCVCVIYITRDQQFDRAKILDGFPEIKSRLLGAEIASHRRGAVSATRKLHRVTTETVALIGDASGSADAITGEGLAISFRHALALAGAISCGSLESYNRAHRQIGRLPHAMGALMLTLDRWPAFQRHALRALAHKPAVFGELLQAHVGHRRLASVLLRRGPAFACNLIPQGTNA